MFGYSLLIAAVLVLGSPYWLYRLMTSARYRVGLGERLGRVPLKLREIVVGQPVVWVHAVSVGEVLAAVRLIAEMETALPGYRIVLSTTTKTGQELAAVRLGASRVFYYPLDLAFAVRRYLNALAPRMLVLMESELWPRMLVECAARGIPVAVVNARVSDRSFPRYMRLRLLWRPLLAKVKLFLAQDELSAQRLLEIGAPVVRVHVTGNLKYDIAAPKQSRVAELIRKAAAGRPIVVAGSTVGGRTVDEELWMIQAWEQAPRQELNTLLVLAPRHPERFALVESLLNEFCFVKAKDWRNDWEDQLDVVLLDTIGDLAAVYGVADVAFVGGSLVDAGGHNPLEPAQFGVPVVMGPSFENFHTIVAKLQAADGIRVVQNKDELRTALIGLLTNREAARAMGERGRAVFAAQPGATARTAQALLELVKGLV